MKAYKIVRTRPHVANEVARPHLPIMFGDHFEGIDVVDFILSDDYRAETEERVDALRPCKIARILAQNIKSRQIQRYRIPENDVLDIFAKAHSGKFGRVRSPTRLPHPRRSRPPAEAAQLSLPARTCTTRVS